MKVLALFTYILSVSTIVIASSNTCIYTFDADSKKVTNACSGYGGTYTKV